MGLSGFRAISGWLDGMGWMDLCVGLFYEHRFAMLITSESGHFINSPIVRRGLVSTVKFQIERKHPRVLLTSPNCPIVLEYWERERE